MTDDIDENITQAIARLIYEKVTGHDWHIADRDPGLDPEWRRRAIAAKRGATYRYAEPRSR